MSRKCEHPADPNILKVEFAFALRFSSKRMNRDEGPKYSSYIFV